MDEGLHPIENEDGEVADEVLQALGEAGDFAPQGNQQGQPTAAEVFNRIVRFEEILRDAWEDFKDEISGKLDILKGEVDDISGKLDILKDDMNGLHDKADELKDIIDGNDPLIVGCSVVLLDTRKIGKVKSLTDHFAEVILDEDECTVKKHKKNLLRIPSIH